MPRDAKGGEDIPTRDDSETRNSRSVVSTATNHSPETMIVRYIVILVIEYRILVPIDTSITHGD